MFSETLSRRHTLQEDLDQCTSHDPSQCAIDDVEVNMKPRSPTIFALCPGTLVHISGYLTALDLVVVGSSCHPLRSLLSVYDAHLWKNLCHAMWRDKQGFRRFCHMQDIQHKIHVSDASRHLVSSSTIASTSTHTSRGGRVHKPHTHPMTLTPTTLSPQTMLRCIQDFVLPSSVAVKQIAPDPMSFMLPRAAIPAPAKKMWWELTPVQQVRRLRRILHATASTDSSSDESIDMSDEVEPTVTWKFAYFMSIRDSKRTLISQDDLLNGEWVIEFRQIPGRVFPMKFQEDGKLITPLHVGGLPYQIGLRGEELTVHVFPSLPVSRVATLEDVRDNTTLERSLWGWNIRNHFVSISSVDIPMPSYLQHLHRLCSPRPP